MMLQPCKNNLATLVRVRVATCALGLMLGLAANVGTGDSTLVGQAAPDFALRTLSNTNVRLSEHTGDVVVINFWATWCGPCRQEMPLLDELYARYQRAGLVMLSINLDEAQERAAEMAQTLKVSYPVLIDTRKQVSRAYGIETLPATVLIDREGVVRYVADNHKAGQQKHYAELLRELLNQ